VMRAFVAKSFHPSPPGRGAGVRANDGGRGCAHISTSNVQMSNPTPLAAGDPVGGHTKNPVYKICICNSGE
jgi:hypothetical protein